MADFFDAMTPKPELAIAMHSALDQFLYPYGETETSCFKIQSGAAGCVKGFGKCFLRVSQAAGLNCSGHAAQASKRNFQKTLFKTSFTT